VCFNIQNKLHMADVVRLFANDHAPPATSESVILEGEGSLIHAAISEATDHSVLLKHNVRLIVQCAEEHSHRFDAKFLAEAQMLRRAGKGAAAEATTEAEAPTPTDETAHLRVLQVNMSDLPTFKIQQALDAALPAMAAARSRGEAVLVNCAAGRSRSAAVILAHLMAHEKMSLAEALNLLRTQRPFAYPNIGFMLQLMVLERRLRGVEGASVQGEHLKSHSEFRYSFDGEEDGMDYIETFLATHTADVR
jgi:predicted protein tyrosine phosphatase